MTSELTTTPARRVCAVCPKPIGPGFLMCFQHWQLVPADLAKAVYRTLGYYEHANGALNIGRARRDYLAAREAAITSVQQQLQQST